MLNRILEQKVFLIAICLVVVLYVPLTWLRIKRAELKESNKEQPILHKVEDGIVVLMTIQFSIFACAAIYYAVKIVMEISEVH